ncbi:MAG: mechanosensitive ion channel [Bacteroidales bacterium]|nr:mechanosensitive ion channel [Bacteroidales bacterium]
MKRMNVFEEMKALLGGKSGKKLVVVSVIVFLLTTAMVFFSVLTLCGNIRLKQMDEYLGEIPGIVDGHVIDDWPVILDRMLAGREAAAFAKTGDQLEVYPMDGFTPGQLEQLKEELPEVYRRTDRFRIVRLLDKRWLAAMRHYPQEETDVLLTVPLLHVVRNGLYIAIAISTLIGLGILLFQIYAFRRLFWKRAESGTDTFSRGQAYRETWPGFVVMLVVTVVFSALLLLLESRSNASLTATAQRLSVQHEIDWRKAQEATVRSTFTTLYRERAQMLADYLEKHPDRQTHAGLEELNRSAKTEYLMLFDRNGQERVSSNSFTGFSVGKNLSEAYRPVLMGYPDAVVGPAADPYTGQMQSGVAILLTDKDGKPDGFLLAVYSADDLNAELGRLSYENTVNKMTVREGRIVAAINDEDGRFVAHTDPAMIGLKAKDFFEDFEALSHFEGFAVYKGEEVCLSANSADGMTLLSMVPEREDSYVQEISIPLVLAVLLILALLYYPAASVLVARALGEAEGKMQPSVREGNPMRVFSDGYSIFLTLFVIFVLIASANGWWTSFDYVFSGQWSKGVHLFSLWAALFVLAATFFFVFLVRTWLNRMESRLSPQSKTIARLVNSLISYVACLFLFFFILSLFGVNTTMLLASAGVISIAVGMGAQSMAADLLAGFFMMLEGSVHVGDHVSAGGVTGYVTDMGIRTTEITDEKGNVVILNNSKIGTVCNMSRNKAGQGTGNDTNQ